jgi:hypothetical protein
MDSVAAGCGLHLYIRINKLPLASYGGLRTKQMPLTGLAQPTGANN